MVKLEVPEEILAYAVRYALGRTSYVVGDVVDQLRTHARGISTQLKRAIVRDIEEYLDDVAAGAYMDQPRDIVDSWRDAVDALMLR